MWDADAVAGQWSSKPEALDLLRFQGEAYVFTLHICKLSDKSFVEALLSLQEILCAKISMNHSQDWVS